MNKHRKLIISLLVIELVAMLIAGMILSSCKPQTVVVEQRDGDYVVVPPPPSPKIYIIERGKMKLEHVTYKVYKAFDVDEQQVCTIWKAVGTVDSSMSCRPMKAGEYNAWK